MTSALLWEQASYLADQGIRPGPEEKSGIRQSILFFDLEISAGIGRRYGCVNSSVFCLLYHITHKLMKSLVLYYSHSDNNRFLAQKLAAALDADIEEAASFSFP